MQTLTTLKSGVSVYLLTSVFCRLYIFKANRTFQNQPMIAGTQGSL